MAPELNTQQSTVSIQPHCELSSTDTENFELKKVPLQPLRRYKPHKHWRGVTPQNETQESRYTYRKV